ncbi:hypothetical protein JRI60_06425 [Archangium violaceum]|uniref:hypothetical protein n=1 Tax=Archangium violaceum TaxID=83451 RepID=UPI00194E4518|nr:hypothetical protein [Archangium violaceum]QRN98678.1 hypothetical protein JRI60_06425 [Archangium violaceum]
MHDGGFKRWVVCGVLASASWLVSACGVLPQQAGNSSYEPGFVRSPAQSGYNGTIKDIPTSIDPRTPQTEGTPGRSLAMDVGERALRQQQGQEGVGGGGPAPVPGSPMYKELGAEGGALRPSRELPDAQVPPTKSSEPSSPDTRPQLNPK